MSMLSVENPVVPDDERSEASGELLRQIGLLTLLVFLVLGVTHREFLLFQPWHEHSDHAVDALKIERARQLRQIHGNYSRFDFYHPGPAFYYVYAGGEQVLYRWLGAVPSPHNAHALAGVLLQSFFFAAALAVAAQWIRRPLFIPLVLLATTVHLGLAGNAFINTWPPRVLLMPFLCFTVSAGSVAAGRLAHLPLLVLAGCFLVHGHVAQPLFVVPGFLMAVGFAWWRERRNDSNFATLVRRHRLSLGISAACAALFLVPLLIDLLAGKQSNLAQIWEFETQHHGDRKPLWKALLFFAGFFGYVKKPEDILTATGPDRATAIGEHVAGYVIWALLIAAVLGYLLRVGRRRDLPERPFVLSLAGFVIFSVMLGLYWGRAQIGKMYEYNGYFYYAVLHAILLLACAAASALPLPRPRVLAALAGVAALVLAWQRQYAPWHLDPSTDQIPPNVQRALEVDPSPAPTKYLVFTHGEWGEAASIALALKRAGYSFRADADWGPKLTPEGAFEPRPPAFAMDGVSTWRLSRRGPTDTGCTIRNNLRVYFEPLPIEPSRQVIDCSENGSLELYMLFGFGSPLGKGCWTISRYAGLVFASPPVASDVIVSIAAEPYSVPGAAANQPATLQVNGHEVALPPLRQRGVVTARIPKAAWNARSPSLLVLDFPHAIRPHDHGISMDRRAFGWHIERIGFEVAP